MLLADRLASTVAPASAAWRAGRDREPRCPRRSPRGRRSRADPSAANSRSVPNGALWPPMVISPPTMPSPGDEMPRLVEFAIVGQVDFRHHAQQAAAMDRQRGVVQRAGVAQRRADQQQRKQLARRGNDVADRGFHRVQQRRLLQQIADRVARHTELRKHRQRGAALVAGARHRRIAAAFAAGSASVHARRAGRDADQSVAIDRTELSAHWARHPILSRHQYGTWRRRRHPPERPRQRPRKATARTHKGHPGA